MWEYIAEGGAIAYILLALSIIGLAIMLSKFFLLAQEKKRCTQVADSLEKELLRLKGESQLGEDALIELTKQEIASHIEGLEKGINTVKIIASISPLLGLLGTVLGVLEAFSIMAKAGTQDPSAFAGSISMALITTVAGLLVAIPHYIGHSYLIGLLDSLEIRFEKELLKRII